MAFYQPAEKQGAKKPADDFVSRLSKAGQPNYGAVTVWSIGSLFVQVTLSPTFSTKAGRVKLLMLTLRCPAVPPAFTVIVDCIPA